ncbi:MAG TPA: YciI family protein [Propionibacteriaceae bacterium]
MKYLLLIYNDEAAAAAAMANTPPEEQAAQIQPWYDYGDWLTEKGWLVTGDALQPTSTATSVRMADGKPVVTDGPFAETKEQLGGYYILDVANLDEAIEAGARCPGAAYGTIELRPLQEFPDQPQG